jgi:S1-C subfamily serine protease
VIACVACQATTRAKPHEIIDVVDKLPERHYIEVAKVTCKEAGGATASVRTSRCETTLRRKALADDADIVVVSERKTEVVGCAGCLEISGVAYRRILPWKKKLAARAKQGSGGKPNTIASGVASGTGFGIHPDGLVVTAYHVIEGARTVHVTLSDGRNLQASVVRRDKTKDLAVLDVSRSLPGYLSFAPPESLKVGSSVWVLGYPVVDILGFEPKYTDGSLSSLSGLGDAPELLQVTVPIQPGNSGGPLLDSNGQVVGVMTSSAAAIPFFRATGSLPQGINWAVKGEYAMLLFAAPDPLPAEPERTQAVDRARQALCLIEAVSGDGLLAAPDDFAEDFVPTRLSKSAFDNLRSSCENQDTRACLQVAEALVRECASGKDSGCSHLRYALTIAHHACSVGETTTCELLRDRKL